MINQASVTCLEVLLAPPEPHRLRGVGRELLPWTVKGPWPEVGMVSRQAGIAMVGT